MWCMWAKTEDKSVDGFTMHSGAKYLLALAAARVKKTGLKTPLGCPCRRVSLSHENLKV